LVALGVAVHRMRRGGGRVASSSSVTVAVEPAAADSESAPVARNNFMYDGGVIVTAVEDDGETL
jgi:hypothetical protein